MPNVWTSSSSGATAIRPSPTRPASSAAFGCEAATAISGGSSGSVKIRAFEKAGFDHVFVHQIGPDQHGFLRFYAEKIIPEL